MQSLLEMMNPRLNTAPGSVRVNQWRIGPAFVLRMEAQYRRWFDAETDNYAFVFGLGTRLGGS